MPAYNYHSGLFYANGDYASCHAPPNFMPQPFNPTTAGDWPNRISFRSLHTNGLNFCLADGSVRFISQTIDKNQYRGLCTRNVGEQVQLP